MAAPAITDEISMTGLSAPGGSSRPPVRYRAGQGRAALCPPVIHAQAVRVPIHEYQEGRRGEPGPDRPPAAMLQSYRPSDQPGPNDKKTSPPRQGRRRQPVGT